MKKPTKLIDELIKFHHVHSLTKKGTVRKKRDFCLMMPLYLLQGAMKSPAVKKALKDPRETEKVLVRGLQWRYTENKVEKDAEQYETLIHMGQLDWLVEQLSK